MKKVKKMLFVSLSVAMIGGVGSQAAYAESVPIDESPQTMYRIYNPNSGEHFYTANSTEKNGLIKAGWKDEGIGWYAPKEGEPVYRLYNKNDGDHHYTMNESEKDSLVKLGWQDEGIGWQSSVNKKVPLYRAYNPNAKTGTHNYTKDISEQKKLISLGWEDEEIAWYGVENSTPTTEKEFIVPVNNPNVASGFVDRINPVTGEKESHKGLDFIQDEGESIFASKAGVVVVAQEDGMPVQGYGKCVIIDHKDGTWSLYAHQSELLVKVGDEVSQGQEIGKVGNTGQSTTAHLHFEIRRSLYSDHVDPAPILGL